MCDDDGVRVIKLRTVSFCINGELGATMTLLARGIGKRHVVTCTSVSHRQPRFSGNQHNLFDLILQNYSLGESGCG